MITIIAATSINGVIGLRGDSELLWHSKVDLEFFQKQTLGMNVVMGNNTFKSLNKVPLKGRNNIVLSKSEPEGHRGGVTYYNSLGSVLTSYSNLIVMGGESLYNMFLSIADEVLLTMFNMHIDTEDGAELAYFPLDTLNKDFTKSGETELHFDTDALANSPIELIFSRWTPREGNKH
jgi:dihydrofolate reductase